MSTTEEKVTSIRVYKKDRDRLAHMARYNDSMKDVLSGILDEYQDMKAKKLFELKHGKPKRSF